MNSIGEHTSVLLPFSILDASRRVIIIRLSLFLLNDDLLFKSLHQRDELIKSDSLFRIQIPELSQYVCHFIVCSAKLSHYGSEVIHLNAPSLFSVKHIKNVTEGVYLILCVLHFDLFILIFLRVFFRNGELHVQRFIRRHRHIVELLLVLS